MVENGTPLNPCEAVAESVLVWATRVSVRVAAVQQEVVYAIVGQGRLRLVEIRVQSEVEVVQT